MSSGVSPTETAALGQIFALIPDVFFSVTVRNTIRRLGYEAVLVGDTEALAKQALENVPRLIIVDATAVRTSEGWQTISNLRSANIPVLAFGPHKDVDTLRQAKSAGVSRVVANSQFHREMPTLIERYIS